MDNSTTPINATNVETFAGPLLLGYFFAWGLYGVLSTQVYTYLQAFSDKDNRIIRTLVATIYAIQTVQILLFTTNGFQSFAAGFGDFVDMNHVKAMWFSICICEGTVACAVQSFYAWRIMIISGRKLPTALISLISVMSFVSAIIVAISVQSKARWSMLFTPAILIKVGFWEASAAICDILIAGCMTYFLRSRAQEGQNERTSAIVNRVIRLTIETGSMTAGVAIITMSVTYIPSHPSYYICPLTTLSGFYATTLMVVLNSRIKFGVRESHLTTWEGNGSEIGFPLRHLVHNAPKGSENDRSRAEGVTVAMEEDLVCCDIEYNLKQRDGVGLVDEKNLQPPTSG